MESLHGKVIFIHDAAHPLAEKIALHLLHGGASVLLSSMKSLNYEFLNEKARDWNAVDRLHVMSFPLRSSEDHMLAKKAVMRGWGGLDAFISLPESIVVSPHLSESQDSDWDIAMSQPLKNHYTLAKAFMPLLALRKSALYINVSPHSVMHPAPSYGMEGISHCIRFMMAQTLSLETRGSPSIHNLVLSSSCETGDNWITEANIDTVIGTLLRNAESNRGYLEFESNWRDRMEEAEERCVGGI